MTWWPRAWNRKATTPDGSKRRISPALEDPVARTSSPAFARSTHPFRQDASRPFRRDSCRGHHARASTRPPRSSNTASTVTRRNPPTTGMLRSTRRLRRPGRPPQARQPVAGSRSAATSPPASRLAPPTRGGFPRRRIRRQPPRWVTRHSWNSGSPTRSPVASRRSCPCRAEHAQDADHPAARAGVCRFPRATQAADRCPGSPTECLGPGSRQGLALAVCRGLADADHQQDHRSQGCDGLRDGRPRLQCGPRRVVHVG